MRQIGIDLGASTVKIVEIESGAVLRRWAEPHRGAVRETLKIGLEECNAVSDDALLGITGSNHAVLQSGINPGVRIDEIPAVVSGVKYAAPEAGCIMDIGGQSSRFITDLSAPVPQFSASEHCAGGTGSFFEDQMSRLGLTIEDFSATVEHAASIPRISGRCAVFAKTDIIHRQQEGVTTPDILLGLCYSMVRNYRAVIVRKLQVQTPIVLCGGVAQNSGVRRAIPEIFSLDEEDLIVPEDAVYLGAIGAALEATEAVDLGTVYAGLQEFPIIDEASHIPLRLAPGTELTDPHTTGIIPKTGCALGIDIGSTSTDLVLVAEDGTLIDAQYLRTSGNPEKAVEEGLDTIYRKYGEITFRAVGVTGSGRTRIGRMIGADSVIDEITAQAKSAAVLNPNVDTVFEIGGQDSKYISIKNGQVSEFQMNKICAAGTGSFLEEQAARMDIALSELGPLALSAEAPSELGERCTVFMETSISAAEASGATKADLSAGLCRSVVRNYLHRVVGARPVGEQIVLQGGVAYNSGLVAAFQERYGDRLTVSPFFPISGAFGVACLAMEQMECDAESTFHGFIQTDVETETVSEEVLHNISLYNKQSEYLLDGYDQTINPAAKTVGIPYVLVIHRMFPMVNEFFRRLGYNVILSDPTNEGTILKAQENAVSETCYPVKLIYGHMKQLMDKHVDYIFLPTIHTMNHEGADVARSYGCVYMQSAPRNVARALDLPAHGIELLSPIVDMEMGTAAMATSMLSLGTQLGHTKPEVIRALVSGANQFRAYGAKMEELGRDILGQIRSDEKVLVLMTRPYGMNDPVLNMGIPDLLLERGYKVITNEHLPGHDVKIGEEYPNMYWPFGQHLLGGAKIVASHPNLYAVYLTNHGCGPDSMMTHLIGEVMGEKPYLQIEVDEHFSKVGVITRIEAFLNSLEHPSNRIDPSGDAPDVFVPKKKTKNPLPLQMAGMIKQTVKKSKAAKSGIVPEIKLPALRDQISDRPLVLPDLGEYSSYLKQYLEETYSLPVTVQTISKEILNIGRAETRAKEAVPYTAFAGIAKAAAPGTDILLPSSTGAEADGVYSLTARTVLRRNGIDNVHVVRPLLEFLPMQASDPDLLFRALLTGDLLYHLPAEKREALRPEAIPTYPELLRFAERIERAFDPSVVTVLAVGTPMTLTSLNEGILDSLEDADTAVRRAPLSEAMHFLWSETPENRPQHEFLELTKQFMLQLDRALGSASAFTSDLPADRIDETLPSFHGGNGRYRFAKAASAKTFSAVLLISPRYENTFMALEMAGIRETCPVPSYSVLLDGDWDEISESRLHSFLHYCKKVPNEEAV